MTNTTPVFHKISLEERRQRMGHKSGVIWLTGLSGSGKTTLALELERRLHDAGAAVYVLDGDNLRHGLCRDLDFSPEAREENIRRIGEVGALMAQAGLIVIAAFISPYRSHRRRARKAARGQFHEVWVKADLETCEKRDTKGLYKMARDGKINDFTGISAPYEEPESPDIVIDTVMQSVDESVNRLFHYVHQHMLQRGE